MALGGGTFLVQNKILPGAYMNFVSVANASATLSDRGIATIPLGSKASRESALPAKQALPTSARWPLSSRIIKSKLSSWNLPSPIKPSSL